ncbi:MAG TPA: phage holin family protein, partial [Solirubrobacterales bacterium]|nr:phage holin family protein [Solirubrobacterales bacterium]
MPAIRRIVFVLLLDAGILLLLSELLDGFVLDGARSALGAAALIGLLNALVWPVVVRFALPLTVLTLGLGALVLNGLLVTVAIDLLPGAEIEGLFEGIVVTIAMTAATAVVYALFAIDEDEAWHRHVVRRQARRRGQVSESEVPGVLFLEIDGLALPVLRSAMRDGNAPTMARWMADGSHRLVEWETDLSSQTGASQAGILLGSNEDISAFRWVEKETATLMTCSAPQDCAEIESRHATGIGLLAGGGASRGNLLSGEAEDVILTVSRMEAEKRSNPGYRAFLANGDNVTRTLVLFVWEVVLELTAALRAIRRDVQPRG